MDSPILAADLLPRRTLARAAIGVQQQHQTTDHAGNVEEWRDGYRRYLIAHDVQAEQAADIAARVAYRPDLYPIDADDLRKTAPNPCDAAPRRARATRSDRLIEASALIATTPPCGDDMAFTHTVLCQVGLPRKHVAAREFRRQSGSMWINIQAGVLDEGVGPVEQPIPYGSMPRLALAWMSTLAKRLKTREIPIGETAADFLRLLGMDDQGNRYATLRKQMHALAACRLQLGHKGRTFNGQPVEQFDAWIATKVHGQRALWPGVVLLSEAYYKELVDHGVPLDNRALLALKGSALALDVYTWLAHRLHRIEGRPVILHWKSLREQFAHEYQGKDPDKDFKKRFVQALQASLAVYPSAKVRRVSGGLLLMSSPPPIPYRAAV